MKKSNTKATAFWKRLLTLFTCLAVFVSCFGMTAMTAFADEADDVVPQSAWEMTVPQIRVTTQEGNGCELQKEDGYQDAKITITDTDGSTLSDECSFKVRGNTTALSWVTKKAFTFKFSKKKDVLGMGKGKKWALIANAFDPTLLRNYTAFALADELGLEYTSNRKVVELWVDNTFRGCYMLYEPVQEGKDRVNIDIESNDGKKDFLLEYEAKRVEEDVTYFTVSGLRFIASEPEEPDEEQLAYIQGTMQDIVDTIRTGTREEVEAKIDATSFAKFYVMNEFLKTYDFDMSSVYFYYQNGKLYAGPPWDYDMCMGNTTASFTATAAAAYATDGVFASNGNLYKYLCRLDWFNALVKRVYHEHYDFIQNIGADGGLLDTAYAQYADVIDRNYGEAGWRVNKWWINYQLQPFKTYQENFDYLKNWARERNAWMSDYYGLPVGECLLGDADGNGTVNISDVTLMQRVLADFAIEDTYAITQRGDVNGDGKMTIEDATQLQMYLAEFPTTYSIGEKEFL